MVWYSHLSKSFPQFVMIHIVKGFRIVDETRDRCFSEIPLLSLWSSECWQFDLWFWDDTSLMAESEEELKNLLMRVKEESEKAGLKLNI